MSSHLDDGAVDGHVTERIVDLLEGALPAEENARIEEHVSRCPDCAADIGVARALRDEGLRRGTRHLSPQRVLSLAAQEHPTQQESAHLLSCGSCRDEIALERAMPPSPELAETSSVRRAERPARSSTSAVAGGWRWLVWAGAAAGVAAVLFFSTHIGRDSKEDDQLRAIARIEALPVELHRSVPEPGSFDELWTQALEQYADRDYVEAERLLERASTIERDRAEVCLYLGSTRLLLGRYDRAAEALSRAIELAPAAGPLAEEGRWQIANAWIALGRESEAEEALRAVISSGSNRRADAEELLSRLADSAD